MTWLPLYQYNASSRLDEDLVIRERSQGGTSHESALRCQLAVTYRGTTDLEPDVLVPDALAALHASYP